MKKLIITILFLIFLSGKSYSVVYSLDNTIHNNVEEHTVINLKSVRTGLMWSIGATIIPIGIGWFIKGKEPENIGYYLIATGIIIGPSVGHFYAEQWGHGFLGIGTRAVVGSIFVCGLYCSGIGPISDTAEFALKCGISVVVGMICWDIALVPHSVQKYNEKLKVKPEIDLIENSYGIGIVYQF